MSKPETRMIVKKYLYPLKGKQIDTLILGCTHYPLLKDIIQHKIGKQVKIIDSSISIASQIKPIFKILLKLIFPFLKKANQNFMYLTSQINLNLLPKKS